MGIQERKEREKEARRDQILEAAEKVFFEKGLAGSTVDDIASVAELSKGTIYLYFRSKEDLYCAVACKGLEVMRQMFVEATSTGQDPIRLIANLGEAYYQFFHRYRDHFRMFFFFESPAFKDLVSPEMHQRCLEEDKKVWAIVSGLIRGAIDGGFFHAALDPMEVSIMLWSNSHGFLRLLDRNEDYWQSMMGVDLHRTLRRSNALLVEAMMTPKAKQLYPSVLQVLEADGSGAETI